MPPSLRHSHCKNLGLCSYQHPVAPTLKLGAAHTRMEKSLRNIPDPVKVLW